MGQEPGTVELRAAQGADRDRRLPPEGHLLRERGGPLTRNGLKSTAHKGVQGLYRRCHERQLGRGTRQSPKERKKLPLSPETKPVLAPVTPAIIPFVYPGWIRRQRKEAEMYVIYDGMNNTEYIYDM